MLSRFGGSVLRAWSLLEPGGVLFQDRELCAAAGVPKCPQSHLPESRPKFWPPCFGVGVGTESDWGEILVWSLRLSLQMSLRSIP